MAGTSSAPLTQASCTVHAPTRIDLAGGTLDIWPLAPILQEKFELWNAPIETVNLAIELRAEARVTLHPGEEYSWEFNDRSLGRSALGTQLTQNHADDFVLHRAVARLFQQKIRDAGFGRVSIETNAKAPRGSGLGGSSALVVALLAAFNKLLELNLSETELCKTAQNLEAGILGNLAGNQDHYAACYGGLQSVHHSAFGSLSQPIKSNLEALAERLIIAHSGQQHFSAFNNWLVLEKALTLDAAVLERCAAIAKIVPEIKVQLESQNWEKVARLLSAEWEIRRNLAPGIVTPMLESLYETALKAGATGGKVCGAGGGGVLVMMINDPSQRHAVETALTRAGGEVLECRPAHQGIVYS
jgi:D-glycero-alpha-D-manno-heptose-7-phosphate kinase